MQRRLWLLFVLLVLSSLTVISLLHLITTNNEPTPFYTLRRESPSTLSHPPSPNTTFHSLNTATNTSRQRAALTQDCNNLLPEHIIVLAHSLFSDPSQEPLLGENQILWIASSVLETACRANHDPKLLVWGVGHDSILWHTLTQPTGTTIFIEDSEKWADMIRAKWPFFDIVLFNHFNTDVQRISSFLADPWLIRLVLLTFLPSP
jgi:hypothetical protein